MSEYYAVYQSGAELLGVGITVAAALPPAAPRIKAQISSAEIRCAAFK